MRFELVVLAHLASSVTGLALGQGGNKLVARDEAIARVSGVVLPTPIASPPPPIPTRWVELCPGKPGYSYSPIDWVEVGDNGSDGLSGQEICLDEEPIKGEGTDIHVERGCIVIEGEAHCAPTSFSSTMFLPLRLSCPTVNVSASEKSIVSVEIYAMFDGDNKDDLVTPRCRLSPPWPSNWRDLDFTADNCITDRSRVWKKCCGDEGNGNDQLTINPYL
ncbi:uncharacterized protein N7500_000303 [Penicillium coprophilum]|uniref:uncharacterized protein n=1 Tax=Penicillium coprophilum TaxID=36646 RepID=UPI002386BEED|nr:uncharacterized protein N7500_000303 [Penicillium coprophilum]KAJ5177604.1 hypothetical protein N7500_000303 [Penicillium coprophilum]